MGILYLAQGAGLANRLRALAGYLAMSHVLGKPFYLRWVPDIYCNAEFSDLFTDSSEINPITQNHNNEINSNPGISIYTANDWFDKTWKNHLRELVDLNEFGKLSNAYLQGLCPSPKIISKVNNFSETYFMQDMTGIHIRSTDNVESYKIWAKVAPDFQYEKVSRLAGFEQVINDL